MISHVFPAAIAATAVLGLALPSAAAEPVTARLAKPIATEARIIAGGALFVCRDQACVASSPGSRTLALSSCRDLAKVTGPFQSFGDGRHQLDQGRLAQCNAAAPADPARLANR